MRLHDDYPAVARAGGRVRQFVAGLAAGLAARVGPILVSLLAAALAWGPVQAASLQKIGDIYYETVEPSISPYRHFLNLPNGEGQTSA